MFKMRIFLYIILNTQSNIMLFSSIIATFFMGNDVLGHSLVLYM